MKTKELKFKVGDKVRVKSLEWYNENKNADGNVRKDENSGIFFAEGMTYWCGKIVQIKKINSDFYIVDGSLLYWQDWMLEDEPVAEEKQEQLLKRNNMETKEMTKEEVFEYLNNTKILCTSKEESEKVQEKLFELGLKWKTAEKRIVFFTFLFIIVDKKIQFTDSMEWWVKSDQKQIEPNEILAIQLKEEKPKFDPQTLKPFDKVLVRQGKHSEWLARFFDFCEDDNYYTTSGSAWVMCVPYNEETKHLHGTTQDAPEYYKIWK